MRRARSRLVRIAYERIELLFNMALEKLKEGDFDLSRRYVEIALKIASKAGVKIPLKYRRRYCRRCHILLIPGITLTVRMRSVGRKTRITYRCLSCGWQRRFLVNKPQRK